MTIIYGRNLSFLRFYIIKISNRRFENFFSKNLFFNGKKKYYKYYFSKIILHKLYLFFNKLEKNFQTFRGFIIFISKVKKLLIKIYLKFKYLKLNCKKKKTSSFKKTFFENIFPSFFFSGSLLKKCTPSIQNSFNICSENFQNKVFSLKILNIIFCFDCKYLHKTAEKNNFFNNFFFLRKQISNCIFFIKSCVSSFHRCRKCFKKIRSFQKAFFILKAKLFNKKIYFLKNKKNFTILSYFWGRDFILEKNFCKKQAKTLEMYSKIKLIFSKTYFFLISKLEIFPSGFFFKKITSNIHLNSDKLKTKKNLIREEIDSDFEFGKIFLSSKIFKVKLKYSRFFLKYDLGIETFKKF